MKFVFDVDGTLTPSRSPINKEFEEWFYNFTNRHKVYLVTGSDYEKTIEQLGERICESVDTVYNCSGSSVWKQGKNVYNNDWHLPITERSFFEWEVVTHELKNDLHFLICISLYE